MFAGAAFTAAQQTDATLNAALRTGRYAEALQLADEALRTRPKDPGIWTGRGLALDAMDRSEDSLASFDRALAINPSFVPALQAGAQSAYRRKDPRAEDYLRRLLAIEPENRTAHGMAAVAAFERADCERASFHFRNAGAGIQTDPLAASMYAQCLLKLGQAARAVDTLADSLSSNPSSGSLRYNLAVAQFAAGRRDDAVRTLEPLATSPDALSLLGTLRAESGDLPGGIAALTKAIDLEPGKEQAYVDLALLCTRTLNWSQAVRVAGEGLRQAPRSARLHSIRGVSRLQLGDAEGAVEDFDKADRLEPRQGLGAAAQGLMLSGQGQPEEAIRSLRDALAKRPGDPVLQFLLADALDRAGTAEKDEAVGLVESSIRTRPDFAPARALLGKLRRGRGETMAAIRELEAAMRLDPANRQAAQQLIIALRQVGRAADADAIAANLRNHLSSKQPGILTIEAPSR